MFHVLPGVWLFTKQGENFYLREAQLSLFELRLLASARPSRRFVSGKVKHVHQTEQKWSPKTYSGQMWGPTRWWSTVF